MPVQDEIRNLTDGVVASFDSGIEAVGTVIEKGLELLDGYRMEQEAVRGSLREALASVGSLRHKDFDLVMERILTFQSHRESEIKTLIRAFLTRQRELAGRMRRSLKAGLFEQVDRIHRELTELIGKAREEIVAFQTEQVKIRETFVAIEGQKGELSVRDFKRRISDLETVLLGPENLSQAVGEP